MELSDNNLASELMENRIFKPITVEEIVIFMSKQTNIVPFRNKSFRKNLALLFFHNYR